MMEECLHSCQAGLEKIADHSTNGPRNFFRSSERIKRRKEKGQIRKSETNGKSIFCQNLKGHLKIEK